MNEIVNENNKNNEITIGFFLSVLFKRLLWLVLALVLGAGLAFGYTRFLATPIYSTSAKFCVEFKNPNASSVNTSYQQGTVQLATGYAYEVTANVFLEQIVLEYNTQRGTDVTIAGLSKMVSVSAEEKLPIFSVKITSSNPQQAYDFLSIIQQKAPELLLNQYTREYITIRLIGYGRVPTAPDSPNMTLNVIIGAVAAFLIAYVIFFLLAFLDKTVYDEEALKLHCKVPVMGQIPQWVVGEDKGSIDMKHANASDIERNYVNRLLTNKTPFSVKESFKTLRTNLTYVAVNDVTPVFGVTSSFAGAGKSLVIANTAISFAQLGKRVLLIDGDMRCPVQHKIFALDKKMHGLSEALAGIDKDPLETCLHKNVADMLDVMTCGRIPPNPSELLASEAMQMLIKKAQEKYDYVLIDLPPILETSDAGVVAPLVSAYIIVVRAGYSRIDAVIDSISTMQSMHANVAGCVLNDINTKRGFGYYSTHNYFSKYGYGRYSRYRTASERLTESGSVEKKNEQ